MDRTVTCVNNTCRPAHGISIISRRPRVVHRYPTAICRRLFNPTTVTLNLYLESRRDRLQVGPVMFRLSSCGTRATDGLTRRRARLGEMRYPRASRIALIFQIMPFMLAKIRTSTPSGGTPGRAEQLHV